MLGACCGHDSGDRDQRGETDRDVDPENRTPCGAGDIDGDQESAGELADSDGKPGGRTVEALRAMQFGPLERGMEGGEDLGHDKCRGGALPETGAQQEPHVRGHPTGQ